jgi:SAM-dependent methyltransferase
MAGEQAGRPCTLARATPPRPASGTEGDYRRVNGRAWTELGKLGIESSTPWNVHRMARPRAWLDSFHWLPWDEIRDVLVLAGGGGQQAPLFARLGCRTTLVDLSEGQLALDRQVAAENGLDLECIQADMCDLSVLGQRRYDLVYQPVSTCYIPDIRRCYKAVASVLGSGGLYWSQHWNPTQIQVSPAYAWDGSAYRLDRPITDPAARVLGGPGQASGPLCWHYVHSLGDLVGGMCDAGFAIEKFVGSGQADSSAEPASPAHLGAYLTPFYTVLARRRQQRWP